MAHLARLGEFRGAHAGHRITCLVGCSSFIAACAACAGRTSHGLRTGPPVGCSCALQLCGDWRWAPEGREKGHMQGPRNSSLGLALQLGGSRDARPWQNGLMSAGPWLRGSRPHHSKLAIFHFFFSQLLISSIPLRPEPEYCRLPSRWPATKQSYRVARPNLDAANLSGRYIR